MTEQKKTFRYHLLFILSFIPLLVQGIIYINIGNIYPLSIGFLLIGFLLYYLKRNTSKAIKTWSILLICFGFVRILLHALMHIDSGGIPSAIYYQFNFWYGLKSVLYVVLGGFLYRKRKHISIIKIYIRSK